MKILLSLFLLAMMFPVMGQHGKLFLVAGQSNAVGLGDSASSVQLHAGMAFEYLYTQQTLRPLKDPVGVDELSFQPANTGSAWPAFAKAYAAANHATVYIVQAARGGSSCHANAELSNYGTWADSGHLPLLKNAVVKTKAAMAITRLPLSGIIWSQGERDANAIGAGQLTAAGYHAALEHTIRRFREAFGADIPFYIIQTGYYDHHPRQGFDAVRQEQVSIAGSMKHVYMLYDQTGSFQERGLMKDEIHYNQSALNEIGAAIALRITETEKNH